MPEDSLKEKTVNGVVWSAVEQFSNQGVQFFLSLVLARLLSPADYGVLGMIAVFGAICQTTAECGLGNALVRKQDRNESDKTTAFCFNVCVAILGYLVMYILAPTIALFFKMPVVCPLLRVTAFSFVFYSFGIVQQAQFTARIDFKTQMRISLSSTIFSGIIGIILAYKGFGVWALAFQAVILSFSKMLLLWIVGDWRPKEKFSRDSFKYLFGYGSKLWLNNLIDTTYNNLTTLVIGKMYTPAQLGIYSRGVQYANLPADSITSIIQRVTFPVLSKIQNDTERLKHDYRRLLKMAAYIVTPIMFLIFSVAHPLVIFTISDKWAGCIPILQIMCLSKFLIPIQYLNSNLLLIKGRSGLYLRIGIIKKGVTILMLCVTVPIGLKAICFGWIFSSVFDLVINTYYTGKFIDLNFFTQLLDILPVIVISIIAGSAALACSYLPIYSGLQLLIGVLVFVIIYIFISVIFKFDQFNELVIIIKHKK